MIKVLSDKRFLTKMMFAGLLMALVFTSLSIFRAHKADLFKNKMAILREKDRKLLDLSKKVDHSQLTELDFEDAAFADFPIKVVQPNSIFVFEEAPAQ